MATTYFCPCCWYHTHRQMTVCPRCGHDLSAEDVLTYEERLLSAVSHPVREYQMIAIEILGRLRYAKAVPVLGELLKTEQDYYLLREAMLALSRIGGHESMAVLASLSMHPSPMVRDLAKMYLSKHEPD